MSPARFSRHRSRSPPVLAIQPPAKSHTKLDALSSSSMLPSPTAYFCEVCYNPSHSTLSSIILSRNALATLAVIREAGMKEKRGPRSTPASTLFRSTLAKNRCFHGNWQQSSSFDQNTRVLQLAKNVSPPAKLMESRYHGQEILLNIFLIRFAVVLFTQSPLEMTNTCQLKLALNCISTSNWLTSFFNLSQNQRNASHHNILRIWKYTFMKNQH